jgi:hypothetical protein
MSSIKNQPCIHKGMSYILYKKISLVYTKVWLMSSIKNQPCTHKGMAGFGQVKIMKEFV